MRAFIITLLFTSLGFSQQATVRYLIGDVQFKTSTTATTWEPLKLNATLNEGTLVKTGAESLCEVMFSDGSITKVLANSLLEIRHMPTAETNDGELLTNLGKFFFYFKKRLLGKVKIRSAVGVAAIRGTQFYLIDEPMKTTIWVKTGKVQLSDLNTTHLVLIEPGFKSTIGADGLPTPPTPLTQQELAELEMVSEGLPQTPPEPRPEHKTETPQNVPPQPQPTSPPQQTPPAKQAPPPPPPKPSTGIRTGVALGAVTIDGKIYNQIGIRPEFSIGKLGVALDLTLYLDSEGRIRKENWDSFKDIIEKIYYVRWGHRGDLFYLKVGAIDNYRLGFGLLMNRYANTVEYPSVIRTGMEIGVRRGQYGFDGMVNNFSEVLSGGGLFAGRFSYQPLGALQLGFSVVYDRNQYKGLKDRDGDGIPDLLDDFPDDKTQAIDSDGDGIPDDLDFDRDGDGFTDNRELLIETFGPQGADLYNEQDSVYLKPAPFDIDQAKDKSQIAFALDASYPILTFQYLKLTTYAQYAKYPYNGAWGITFPGFWAKFAFINAYAEYRIFGKGFLPEYFNTTYELERATYRTANDTSDVIIPYTKRQYLNDYVTERLRGFVIGADFNLWNFVIFGAEYQNMSRASVHFRTFRANLDLNTSFIPKINRAGAYYYQNNAIDLFSKTEGTILGYRIEYEISPSASLLFDFRQTYRDLNGDGKISGPGETVKTTLIQTVMRF